MPDKRHLILSADERGWKFDRPVVFLGEWCRILERRDAWKVIDGIVMPPYGVDPRTKLSNRADVAEIEAKLFPMLCQFLNEHHKTTHSERFWQILLGHWFRRVINILINRYNTLDLCLKFHEVSSCNVYRNPDSLLVTRDSEEFNNAADNDLWNHALFSLLLNSHDNKIANLEFIEEEGAISYAKDQLYSSSPTASNGIKSLILNFASKILQFFSFLSRTSDPLIIGSYLPFSSVIKLHLMLGRFPQIPISPKFKPSSATNIELRKNLSHRFALRSGKKIEMVVSSQIPRLLPKCYLEGFDELSRASSTVDWPKEPMFIFTCNNFDTDEIFKCWVANKVEQGYKYYVGQHGSSYGVSVDSKDSIEELSSCRFFTWGWSEGPKYSRGSVFTLVGRHRRMHDPLGGITLIELCRYSRLYSWDSYAEYSSYFAEQLNFTSALDKRLKNQLIVRLHPNNQKFSWDVERRWLEFDPDIILDKGNNDIRILIKKSRLLVFSYDSTTLLEVMAENIPTLVFWRNGLNDIRESAEPYYRLLVDAGILHFSGVSAAKKANDIWRDVSGWWGKSEVQRARTEFCNHYASSSATPLRDLKVALKEGLALDRASQ